MTHKILVVDDDADTRRILRYLLEPLADVIEAAGGADALRLIATERPHLVLLDVAMPEIGGLEVLKSGRELAPGIVVVMLSGQSDIAVAKTALERGARAYITKPVDTQQLCDVIEDLLGINAAPDDPGGRKPWRVVG